MKHPKDDPEEIGRLTRELLAKSLPTELAGRELLDRLERYSATLARWGRQTNLTAEPDNSAEIAFHIVDSLAPLYARPSMADRLGAGGRVADLGSGAGFPGLILGAACAARFTLIEARRKRANFLRTAVMAMGLYNVEIDERRGGASTGFDLVTARAFGPPGSFYASASGLIGAEGVAILYANPGQELELAVAAAAGLRLRERLDYSVRRSGSSAEVPRTLAVFSR